jgi:hypothetical protein
LLLVEKCSQTCTYEYNSIQLRRPFFTPAGQRLGRPSLRDGGGWRSCAEIADQCRINRFQYCCDFLICPVFFLS